jgi:lambda family phage portal protein
VGDNLNIFDRVIESISPSLALKREISRHKLSVMKKFNNSGYDQSGASTTKKSMKGWTAFSKSPQEDIDVNLNVLRQRSRDLYMSSPLAVSAIKTNRTNVVGSGLKLKSKIDYKFLGISKEAADEWEKNVEREFSVWASSKFCDATRVNDFYEMQQLALISWLLNGDAIGVIKNQSPQKYMPYGLRIHLIEADRVSTPNTYSYTYNSKSNQIIQKLQNGNWCYNGVEIDLSGAIVAYHICNQHPNSTLKAITKKWERIEAFGPLTGNQNIIHVMESERCEQYRGIPYLAPVIEILKQITRYTEAELTAAVIQAFFTAFIKTEAPTNEVPLGESIPEEERVDTDPNSYELGAGSINALAPGEDVVFADPKRPASGFENFVNALSKHMGAALEVPFELLTKSFMASYSASRAALLEAWKAFKMRRIWFATDFCQPIYVMWLSEAVARGRIKAPGYFNDLAFKNAYCKAEWIGPSQGQIDPVKEVNASILKVDNGFSTRERETTELTGGNWDDNIDQITRENKLLREARGIIDNDKNSNLDNKNLSGGDENAKKVLEF